MKLYATVTSERASKGQGGEYLDIVIKNEHQRIVARIEVRSGRLVKTIVHTLYDKTVCEPSLAAIDWMTIGKGNKQKGEIKCPQCGKDVWDVADGYKLSKCHNCGTAFD